MTASAGLTRSVAFRQAVVYALLFGASVIVLFGFFFWSTAGYLARQVEADIEAEQVELAERYRLQGLQGVTQFISERLSRQPAGPEIYLFADANLDRIGGNISGWPDAEPDARGWVRFRLGSGDGGDAEVRWASAKVFRLEGGYNLLVGRDMQELEAIRANIVRTLRWGIGLTMLLALAGGVVMGRGTSRRVRQINGTIGRIMDGDLSQRLPLTDRGDEFDQLSHQLNRMLGRIEVLMDGVRQVSDNIAHDLRTPLARMRNRLEGLRGELDADASPTAVDALDEAVGEADALLKTFSALLRIARIEASARREGFRVVDVSSLLRDVAELYEPLAEERGQEFALHVDGEPTLDGDRDLLFQAIANIVDNAIKYTPEGGAIDMRLDTSEGRVRIVVADNGPGVAAADRSKLFERFWRADGSRTTAGSGLGLSLVHAVAQLHGMDVVVADNAPGLRVELTLPA